MEKFKHKIVTWYQSDLFWPTWLFLGLCFLVVIVFWQRVELSSSDLGRHLENGRLVFTNPEILFRNFFSYTEPELRFINHHWLAGVLFYVIYLLGGFKALSIFNILLALTIFSLFFYLAVKRSNFYIASVLSIPVIFLMTERVEIRPEMFSCLFLALTWLVLESKKLARRQRLFILLPLFIIWANIHIYFFLGLALAGFYVASSIFRSLTWRDFGAGFKFSTIWPKVSRPIIDFGLLVGACLFNPNHIRGLLYPFNIFKNYGYQVAENKSIFFLDDLMLNYNFQIFKLLLGLLIISLISAYLIDRRRRYASWLFAFFISLLGLFASRNLTIFGLVALVLISGATLPACQIMAEKFSRFKLFPWLTLYLVSLTGVIVFAAVFLITDLNSRQAYLKNEPGLGVSAGSEEAFKFFKAQELVGPIFNNYDAGSALIFGLPDAEQVFVDNRPEAYSVDFFKKTYLPMQTDGFIWNQVLQNYNFKTIFFAHTDSTPWGKNFIYSILRDSQWRLVYFDSYYVILLRADAYPAEKIAEIAVDDQLFRQELRLLSSLASLKNKFNLAELARAAGHPDLAEEIYRQIMLDHPNNVQAIFSRAALYASLGDSNNNLYQALDYYERGLKKEPRMPGIYSQIGLIYWRLADYQQAENYWRQARSKQNDQAAKDYLAQIDDLRRRGLLAQ